MLNINIRLYILKVIHAVVRDAHILSIINNHPNLSSSFAKLRDLFSNCIPHLLRDSAVSAVLTIRIAAVRALPCKSGIRI